MDATANESILVGCYSVPIYRVFYPESSKIKLSRDIRIEEDKAPEFQEGWAIPFLEYELENVDSVNSGTKKTSGLRSDFDGSPSTTDGPKATLTPFIENINLDELTNTPILWRSLRTNASVPPVRYGSSDVCLVTQNRLSTSTVSYPVPLSFNGAVQFFQKDSWWSGMEEEITAINPRNVWTLNYILQGIVAVKTEWVYSIKDKNCETFPTLKARLVAKGFMQEENIVFIEVFAPAAKYSTIRFLLATDVHYG